ncbi:MAG: NAD-binding protein [Candidatus Phosphoribacter sp.]
MVNPLMLFSARPWARRAPRSMRRTEVEVPNQGPTTDAVFLVLRRLRVPLVVLIIIFGVSVAGLSAIPGQDSDGNPLRMTVFDAFYFMSYTATTIGFGELPQPFTTTQRMWVTASIYSSVIGWAYAIGTMFGLIQEQGFRDAIATEQFRRRVRRIEEPFLIISGFGHAGRLVAQGLDDLDRRFVVIDGQRSRIELLSADQLSVDPPGIHGDLRNPALLGLAGLGNRHCEGVLALTDNDDINLATVMMVNLLRPDVPVIARCGDRLTEEHMHDFAPAAVINPYDRFGGYLLLALNRPVTSQLVTWLLGGRSSRLPPLREGLASGRWVVCADGQFGEEVSGDLRRAGLDVTVVDPARGDPDVTDVRGFVAGTERDTANLSLAVHARLNNPDIFLVVRQKVHTNAPLLQALHLDAVFMPTDLVAREMLARVVTPLFWSFIDHALIQDDEWSAHIRDRLVEAGGTRTPNFQRVDITPESTPAVHRWLVRGGSLTIGDLLRHHDDRELLLPLVPLVVQRGEGMHVTPTRDFELAPGDRILLAGRTVALGELTATLYYDSTVEYLATGVNIPSTWVWRVLTARRRRASPD